MTKNASEEQPTAVSSVVGDGTDINDEVDNIQDVNDDDTINAACEFDIIEGQTYILKTYSVSVPVCLYLEPS